jgi:DnaJ-class molecular chaperone
MTHPPKIETLCPHCEGQGYTELRDCSGEVQREETCSFCHGTGKSKGLNWETDSHEYP